MPLHIDLKNAIEQPRIDNFTCLLFRLAVKADAANLVRLEKGYPVEVEMMRIFRNECLYKDEKCSEVDWEAIERLAQERRDDNSD